MWLIAVFPATETAGPLFWTRAWGITSLSITLIDWPRWSAMLWAALNALPSYDQLWQPRSWWRMSSVPAGLVAAPANEAPTARAAVMATSVRFMTPSFLERFAE